MTEPENRALPEPEYRGGEDPDFAAVKPGTPLQVPVPGQPAAGEDHGE